MVTPTVLQREETWLLQAERAIAVFALASAWVAAAGYAYIGSRDMDELAALRARADLVTQIEARIATMTPTERRQFDTLMKPTGSAKR